MIDLETQRTYDLKDIILTELHKQLDWKIKQRLYKLPYRIIICTVKPRTLGRGYKVP
jgi:hypothetical protein